MKYLKYFEEVGIKLNEFNELTTQLRSVISTPHIPSCSITDEEDRNLMIKISGNQAKFGTMLEVGFFSDYPFNWDELNQEIKSVELIELIKSEIWAIIMMGENPDYYKDTNVLFYGYNIFNKKKLGKIPNGGIKEVYDEYIDLMEELGGTSGTSLRWYFALPNS
jgi:hypothetical protein